MPSHYKKLLDKVTFFENKNDALNCIRAMEVQQKKLIISFVNAHAFNMANKDSDFFNALMKSDIVLRDGIGVSILCKLLNLNSGYNFNGTDFIPEILQHLSQGRRIAVFGTRKDVIISAQEKIESFGGRVILMEDGFQTSQHYVEIIKSKQTDIILLAMGMPKQEMVAQQVLESIDSGIIICGGAIIDFLGGKVQRAPNLFIRMRLEWLYRLMMEPKRLFRRYVFGNVIFLYNALLLRLIP
jgi:exopolysaccharide biosynthesis WecB/TagA/CpsF family protein